MSTRQIKFRAWDGKRMYANAEDGIDTGVIRPFGDILLSVDWRVMQYTGLKDKNGREIYEGDVLREGGVARMLVVYRSDLASFALRKAGWAYDHFFGEGATAANCEVMGNVYENPELIKS